MNDLQKLLDLEEFNINKIQERKEGGKTIKLIYVESKKKKQRCPICNEYTSSIHDRLKPMELKYLKVAESNTKIIVTKRRFVCHKCNKKFTEELNLNERHKSITMKLELKIRKDLLEPNFSMKYIAKANNVSDGTVRRILLNAMEDYPKQVKNLPSIISFDEFKADTNRGKYAFIMNDPIHKKTLDILPTRKKEYLIQYFTHCENRHSVEFVISDMYEPYLLVQKVMFPKAKYVVDRFHYIKYIMEALDNIRIRLQKKYGYNSHEYRMLKNKKNVTLLRKYSKDIDWYTYTKRQRNKHQVEILKIDLMHELLVLDNDLYNGYYLKEEFLDIVNNSNYEHAEEDLKTWITLCKDSCINEFIDAASTIEHWLPYIVNSFVDKRFSNGYTEGLNKKIKDIKRTAYGYKDFDFFRLRIMYILNGKISGKSQKTKNTKI